MTVTSPAMTVQVREHDKVMEPYRHGRAGHAVAGRDLQQQAWLWALAHTADDGSLPSGLEIARQHGRGERWGRLVKRTGAAGEFATEPSLRLIDQRLSSAEGE